MINILNNAKDVLISNIENHDDRLIFIRTSKNKNTIFISIKEGVGLGLYMSRKIVEEINYGKITVKNVDYIHNDKEYKGAEFKIPLPIL